MEHTIDILKAELEMTMRLMGVTSLEHVRGNHKLLAFKTLDMHATNVPNDYLSEAVYDRMSPVQKSKL